MRSAAADAARAALIRTASAKAPSPPAPKHVADDDPLGVDNFATHILSLDEAPHAYDIFQKKQDGAVKVILRP